MNDYIIIGDTKNYKNCLVYVCGTDLEYAEEVLNGMLNNPTEQDKKIIETHSNLRIAAVPVQDCWWRGNCD